MGRLTSIILCSAVLAGFLVSSQAANAEGVVQKWQTPLPIEPALLIPYICSPMNTGIRSCLVITS